MKPVPFPQRVEIELASACNLRCTYCPRHFVSDLKGFMKYSLFMRLIDELAAHPDTILVLHRRGESLLHPKFISILEYVRGKFNTIQLATNATLLSVEKAKAIINSISFISFSIDTPSVFNNTRIPARYDEVASNIHTFLDMNATQGAPVETQVSMVKTSETKEQDIERFLSTWKHKVDRVRIYDQHSENGVFGAIRHKRVDRRPCVMPSYEMLIYCDGTVGRCNHDWDGEPIGDISTAGIKEIWNGATYRNLREQHKNLRITDTVCATCDSWYPAIGHQGTGKVIE